MSRTLLRRPVLALAVGAALLAGCTAPAAEVLVREPVALVEARLGEAPRWRAGGSPSAEEDARVRALLATPLDAVGAVEVALVRSRRVQALLEHAIAEALDAHADAAPANPVLDALVRWPHGPGGPLVDLGLTFGLLDVLRLPGRGDAAALAARGAALEAAEAILEVAFEVRTAWIEAVAARERESLDADAAETASIAAELAARQHAAGTLSQFDLLRFRAFADESLAAADRARTESGAAKERLVRALGVFGDEATVSVSASLPQVPDADPRPDDVESRAVARRLDLERARVAVVEARLAAGLAADERTLPDLGVGASFEREIDGARSTGPGVSAVLPLSAKEVARSDAALARAREAEDRLYDLAVRVRSEAREADGAFRGATAVEARYRDSVVPLRAAAVEEAQLRYNGMLLGVYDLLAEKREELRATRDLVDAGRDAWIARLDLERALGGGPLDARETDGSEAAPAPPARSVEPHHHGGH